jgi:hypothetical protein
MPVSQVTLILHTGITYTVHIFRCTGRMRMFCWSQIHQILLHNILIQQQSALRWCNMPEKLLAETTKHFKGVEIVMEVTHKNVIFIHSCLRVNSPLNYECIYITFNKNTPFHSLVISFKKLLGFSAPLRKCIFFCG